jgi:hypothetical protein
MCALVLKAPTGVQEEEDGERAEALLAALRRHSSAPRCVVPLESHIYSKRSGKEALLPKRSRAKTEKVASTPTDASVSPPPRTSERSEGGPDST